MAIGELHENDCSSVLYDCKTSIGQNILRYYLSSAPHPSENAIQVRIQMYGVYEDSLNTKVFS